MSHLVSIQTQIKDRSAVISACRRLGLAAPEEGTATLFSGEVSGLIVRLPEWQYPVVIDLPSGKLQLDNFNGIWGDQSRLGAFLQAYAVEKTKIEAHKKGCTVSEQTLQDGSIKLQLLGGA